MNNINQPLIVLIAYSSIHREIPMTMMYTVSIQYSYLQVLLIIEVFMDRKWVTICDKRGTDFQAIAIERSSVCEIIMGPSKS